MKDIDGIELSQSTGCTSDNSHAPVITPASKPKRGSRFWLIMAALCLSLFLAALEFTAVATALPIISADLRGGSFIWVGTAYALASSAILPMTGGAAQIFGRRPTMVASIFLFAFGSALCGAAQSMTMLIIGRTVQGMGGGGILSFSAIILADLVPLRERGIFAALFGLTWSLAAAIGPVVGGGLSNEGQWRWIFYLNLPLCALAGSAVQILVKLPTPTGSFRTKILSFDWIGNVIIIGATAAVTVAFVNGGVVDSWTSAKILTPLIIGVVGLVIFLVYESRFPKNPLVPFSILANRTSASGYVQTFLLPVTSLAGICDDDHLLENINCNLHYLPVYFQACKGADASRSGILSLSMASVAIGAVIGGPSVKLISRYRPQIWFGWILQTLGISLLTTVKLETHVGVALVFIIIYGTGAGINYALQVYPIQAPLPVTANAHALAFFSFMRTFAGVWGVILGGLILQNELHHRLPPEFLVQFPSGIAIVYSSIPQISSLPEPLRTEVRKAFIDSLRVIWEVIATVCGLGFISTLFMKAHPLHDDTDKEWAPPEEIMMVTSEPNNEPSADSRHGLVYRPVAGRESEEAEVHVGIANRS
ncbi:hypothetical protein Clacol_005216 [Clathrus columnatus]|uniref:Major facilitator superfamily (MFS) profile domain-containing protein n=1 Tax=Clathrus columnatus TaxID=1419009 RepID=A0AAV5ABB1_9AGAM|nr:hypothetical protein Clacol_005216 [Clathrus columnatus]